MAILRVLSISFVATAAMLAVAGCDRGGDAARNAGSTSATLAQPAPPTPSASTPMPVSPSGTTNASTAAQGTDLSNSTRATGNSNTYQPPSGDNPAPGASGASVRGAGSAASGIPGAASSSTGQTTSSQTLGTSPQPNDGTLPGGTTGSTGSRRGGGKS